MNPKSLPSNPLFDMEAIQDDEVKDPLKAAGLAPATKVDPKVDPERFPESDPSSGIEA